MIPQELIKKFGLKLATKDGQECIEVRGKKPTPKQIEEIQAKRGEIIEALKIREAELDAIIAARMAKSEEEKEAYLATADLRRYLVCSEDEGGTRTYSLQTLEHTAERPYQVKYGCANYIFILATETVARIKKICPVADYGLCAVAWQVTPEQEEKILAEQVSAQAQAEKEAVEKEAAAQAQAEKETARQAIFAEAKETGRPVLLRKWSTPCCDSREECSTDMHYETVQPDGTVSTSWTHTW